MLSLHWLILIVLTFVALAIREIVTADAWDIGAPIRSILYLVIAVTIIITKVLF
jgi:hypothetical protein